MADKRCWQLLSAGYLGKGNEGFVLATHEHAPRAIFFRVSSAFGDMVERVGISDIVRGMQRSAVIGTILILKKLLVSMSSLVSPLE